MIATLIALAAVALGPPVGSPIAGLGGQLTGVRVGGVVTTLPDVIAHRKRVHR